MNATPQIEQSNDASSEQRGGVAGALASRCWWAYLLGVAFLVGTMAWLYGQSLHYDLIFDDVPTIEINDSIHELFPLFGKDGGYGPLKPQPGTPVTARPVVSLAMAINYHFGGEDPAGYRLVHYALHIATAILIWAIVAWTLQQSVFPRRINTVAGPLGYLAALLWMVHPCHSETIIYLTQRTELMMGFFYLLTVYLSLRYWRTDSMSVRAIMLLLATLSCISGMMCKEMMASVPAMVLLYEWTFLPGTVWQKWKRSWPLYFGLALGWIPITWLYISGYTTPLAGFNNTISAVDWWMTQANAFFMYWKLTFVPYPLLLHRHVETLTQLSEAWPGVAGLVVYAIVTLALVWRRRPSGYVLVWFFAVLSPTLIVPLPTEEISERRLYVPLAAVAPLLVVAVFGWWGKFTGVSTDDVSPRPIAMVRKLFSDHWMPLGVFTILILLSVAVTKHTMPRLSSRLTIWTEVLKYEPNNPFALLSQGSVDFNEGKHEQGLAQLKRAFNMRPGYKMGVVAYAKALEDVGQKNRILDVYRQSITANPTDPILRYNLAFWLEQNGKQGQAIDAYRQSLKYDPKNQAAHTNLGALLADMGYLPEAIEHFEAAVDLYPDVVNCTNLMTAYLKTRQNDQAIVAAEKLLDAARRESNDELAWRIERSLRVLKATAE